MSKKLEALQKLRDLVEYLTRIDYVSTDLRNEVKELLIKSYEDSNGYFSQIEEALKRNEPMKVNIIATHDEIGLQIGSCSNCGSQTISHYRKGKTISLVDGLFCSTCGQKLDWSDEI